MGTRATFGAVVSVAYVYSRGVSPYKAIVKFISTVIPAQLFDGEGADERGDRYN